MLEVYFLVRTFDYLTLILFAHHIKQLFRNVFPYVGFDMTDLIKSVLQIKQNLNLSMINMITGINESKTLTNHISCECEFKFHGRKCN